MKCLAQVLARIKCHQHYDSVPFCLPRGPDGWTGHKPPPVEPQPPESSHSGRPLLLEWDHVGTAVHLDAVP